ncbi:MAG TPA: cysteine desulfurase NifS [Phycisphaerae bacterium]|nr:cysteine desulfurase NifS [Phycisphaerae bacterium]
MDNVIYLDNNATTAVAPEVREAMLPFLGPLYGNPSSIHTFGGQVKAHLDEARERVADLLGCHPTEIIFASCGTESDNTAITSALDCHPERHHIISTRVEHPAVKNLCQALAQGRPGRPLYRVTEIPVDAEGLLDVAAFEDALDDNTAVVSCMWANNETGVLFPVETVGALCRDRGVLFHTDAIQAAGKIPMNVSDLPIDMLSLSGHKLHAPKGIGALYVQRGTRFSPHIIGGHQEGNRRGGTESVPLIVALGKAAQLARQNIDKEGTQVAALRDRLEKGLLEKAPDARVNGNRLLRLPNTTNISFEYVEGEAILLMLDQHGVCASSGSACTTGSLEPSHVLRAMGVPFTAAHGSIRFSLSVYNTDEEIDKVLEVLPPIIRRLREISPFGHETKPAAGKAR